MSNEITIKVESVSKVYPIFRTPQDRLKQMVLPPLWRWIGWAALGFRRRGEDLLT